MRYERKYRIDDKSYQQVYHEIISNIGVFHKAFPDRSVNSIYLDDIKYRALNENLSGISVRLKFRLRWYGEDIRKINNPVLEKKIKINQLGYKKLFPLASITNSPGQLRKIFDIPFLNDESIFPTILIKYQRTYLESFDRRVRVTIDRNLRYYGMNNYSIDPFPRNDDAIILEIKYDESIENEISDILQSIPYRLTKNSKFCSGMLNYWS